MNDSIEAFAAHALDTRFEDLPEAALHATRVFLLDSLGVGVAGSSGPFVRELIGVHGGAPQARVLGTSARLPGPGAAFCNAYQIHNSEFDCIHERAVVHPMAVVLGTVLAWIDAARDEQGTRMDGRALASALVLGVDIACRLGVAARAPLRFFRPAIAGAMGATAALGRLRGFDATTWRRAMGIAHAQLCGTMQAHREGSPLLAMQVGFNARNAYVAAEMAAAGIPAPAQVLEGEFGYLPLFEQDHDAGELVAGLGSRWCITEVAHKPFPSGRATHGLVDACLQLAGEHGLAAATVERVECEVPPLTHRLVGRPPAPAMEPNYARLCAPYVMACALRRGTVRLADFGRAALDDPATLALAARIDVRERAHPDANALAPVTVRIALRDGRRLERSLDTVYGNPSRPMTRDAQLAKFRKNLAASAEPLDEESAGRVIGMVDRLESLHDVSALIDALVPPVR